MDVDIRIEGEYTRRIDTILDRVGARLDEHFGEDVYFCENPEAPVVVSNERFKGFSKPEDILFAEVLATASPTPNPFPCADNEVLYMDIETHNAGREFDMSPREFFRLGQYAWGIEGEIRLTTDYDEMMSMIAQAQGVVAHNGHNFDWSVLFGRDSMTPLFMARDRKLLDTMVWANLAFPAPNVYTDRNGHTYRGVEKPTQIMKWLSLDNLAFQFGIEGKYGDLKELAKRHNPPKTKVADLDYGLIPVDDPEFVAYAKQDIVALQGITKHLCYIGPMSEYDWREQLIAGLNAQITRNGFPVDAREAQGRVDELQADRERIMNRLVEEYDFPTEGKSPWASNAGKDAILRIFADYGITPETHDWPLTPTGAPKLGGDDLIALAEGTGAEEVAGAIASVKGQRSLAQLTLDCYHGSTGSVHPDINDMQRSGRSCLPEAHRLLTRRGIVPVDDIRVGEDETLDKRGNWVRVTDVHRYSDAPVERYETKTALLESTPEHRWVQWTESRITRTVEPISRGTRRFIQLAPDSYPFDPFEMNLWAHMTDRERVAALVGFLITDGHASNRHDCNAGRFVVYQTENKFYKPIRKFLGDLVTSDYSRPAVKHSDNVVHEMRLNTSEVERILTSEGLDWDGGLRNSPTLFPWVLSLSRSETEAFLTATYISDGRVEGGTPEISNINPNKVAVLQIASYRLGRRPNYRMYDNPENYQLTGRVALTRPTVGVRTLPEPDVYYADVWCVSTETGTFTAWGPDGRWSMPYLTGNSVTKPGLTVWNSRGENAVEKSYYVAGPGHKLVSFDYSNADARAVAAYSQDKAYRENFLPGVDNHMNVARLVYGDREDFVDDKHHPEGAKYRQLAKALSHAWNYGGGAKTISRASGQPLDVAEHFVEQMNKAFPRVVAWRNEVAEHGERDGFIKNKWGRKMPVVRDRAYTQSSALLGQSGTREVMKDSLIRMLEYDPRLIQWVKVPVHDELIFSIPESELAWAVPKIEELMYYNWDGVEFYASHGAPSDNWEEAGH